MTGISLVGADWLALRAAADDAARSGRLAALAARRLGAGPITVHDLGSGTGAMARWLAPRLRGPQRWVLHDGDPGILEHLDPTRIRDAEDRPVPVRTSVERLADLDAAALAGASLVTASALLDVITAEEARVVVAACVAVGAPALLALSVTGRVDLAPADPLDGAIAAAFDDHQRRVTDGRRLLGPGAASVVAAMFAEAGWRVTIALTPWRLGASDGCLIGEWLDGWIAAAVEQRPELLDAAEHYRDRRLAAIAAGALRVDVHHEDVLAWPA